MMKKKLTKILGALLVTSLVFGACSPNASNNNAPSGKEASGSENNESTAGKDTLVIATGAEPKSLDAHGANDGDSTRFKHLIYDTLLRQDENQAVIPGLVESWEIVDETSINLKLREGVKFHNGNDFNADDVMYTLKRAFDSEFGNWMVWAIDFENSKAVDVYNIELKLTEPCGAQLTQLAFLYVVDKETVEEMGADAFAENPVGTGPFMFKEWYRGDRVEYTTYKDYWGTVPSFDNLTMRIISESSSRTIEIESGGVDVSLQVAASDISLLEDNDDVKLLRTAGFGNNFIGFNCAAEPFNNVKVRQAFSYAVDKYSIVEAVYSGMGSVADGPISPAIWGYNPNLKQYEQDSEKAKALLAEAGYPDGIKVTLTTSDKAVHVDIAEMLQNQLSKAGIEVEVITLENATYLDRIINGEIQMYVLGWTTNTGDADYGLYETFHTGMPSWSNTARYENTEVDELLEIGRKNPDQAARQEAYNKAQEIIVEEAPWIFLYNSEEVAAVRSNIDGLVSPPSGRYEFNTITFND
ncbi:ABC transporter substrate-binding protein [Anaeropeptidivorans aminofermentans]|uniref:ABC transporter substrate-binding protein n=1 Tax=Anaeropeptidivorans aminofermentans TaxID=2934315 RepID=UPI002025116D|nr:ABC transporter substrate-binding protein [Anaeropeptidivorans aminofermentans]